MRDTQWGGCADVSMMLQHLNIRQLAELAKDRKSKRKTHGCLPLVAFTLASNDFDGRGHARCELDTWGNPVNMNAHRDALSKAHPGKCCCDIWQTQMTRCVIAVLDTMTVIGLVDLKPLQVIHEKVTRE